MPDPVLRTARPWRSHWPALVLALLAAVVAVLAKELVFPALSWNRDEPVYLWHVELLRHGQLTATDGGHPELFLPWLSAARDGAMFTQYTLGWPLVLLAARLLTGTAAAALPISAALAVVGTYALALELLDRRRTATVAAALMVASPLLAIQGGVYLSYLFTLGLGLLFGVLVLSGIRLASTGRLLAAGPVLGWIFLTRPYDAVLWGLAFGLYVLVVERARWWWAVRRLLLPVATSLPLVLAGLAYNRHVTGGWLEFPITVADPLDTFGFGRKRLMPGFDPHDYTIGSALKGTAKNAFFLPWFLAGSYAALAAAAVGLWIGRRHRATLALVLIGAVFPLGYFPFWGNHLSAQAARISGPIYFVPLFAAICILVATVVVRWQARRPVWGRALVVVLVLGTLPVAWSRLGINHEISEQQEPWRQSVEGVEGRAIVFVVDTGQYLLYSNPFSANPADLDGRLLFAALHGPSALDLIAEQPDRAVYLQQGNVAAPELGPREDPYDLDVTVTPATVQRGSQLVLTVEVDAPPDAHDVLLEVTTGAGTVQQAAPTAGGPLRLQVVLDAAVPPVAGGTTDGRLGVLERGTIDVTAGWGDSPEEAGRSPQRRQSFVYRTVEGRIEALTPSSAERYELLEDHHEWRHVADAPEVAVDLRPIAGP
ncbi:MAG TPA: hypothetical protein VFV32_06975 [Acidimicrobiales bacterium]|nr:hypothetical protein [Acidimicrobiales bacterium]